MSRKSRTTLYLRVKFPMPPGTNIPQVQDYIRAALGGWKEQFDPADPMFNIQREEITVSVEKKETVYF